MKKILVTLLCLWATQINAQNDYWQQHLNYQIDVTLKDKINTLEGFQKIVYTNNSPDTLHYIWFHIWPNAYSSDSTALLQQIRNDNSRQEKASDYVKGNISNLNFKVNGIAVATEPHPNKQYVDVIKVNLPKPLLPNKSDTITTPFTVKLPNYFSRSGFADGQYMITQWYPKPAVYDKNGWHEFPYLDMGEYYSEYADYKVNITLPGSYVVGATGVLQTKNELSQYKSIGSKNAKNRRATPLLYVSKLPTKKLTYQAINVPDFAWFAEKNIVIQYDTLRLPSGKIVDAFTFFKNKKNTVWENSIDYVKDATKKYSEWIGEYEYPTVQAFEGPKNNFSGGMEYPMITLITSPDANIASLDGVIAHEVGHNWFMSMLGTNERKHAWLDEGLNTYFQFRYEAEKYRSNSIFGDAIPDEVKKLSTKDFLGAIYGAMGQIPMNSAIDIPSEAFKTSEEYGLIAYIKTALWLYILEANYGSEAVDKAFQYYFSTWKNKHPQPEDFKAAVEKSLGANLTGYFKLLKKEGGLQR